MSRESERLGALTGIVATVTLGVAVLIATIGGFEALAPAHPVGWWLAYVLYVLVFLAADAALPLLRAVPEDVLVAAQVVLGIAVFALAPELGWSAVILVVSAASAAFVWPPRVVGAVVAAQTLAVAVAGAATGYPAPVLVTAVLAYGSFQGFAALVVHSARSEAEARSELAVAHAELRAASTMLEATSREAERLRIARDLHDVVGHTLTALALELEVASHHAEGQAAEHVRRARDVAKDLLRDVRATVGRLREPAQPLEPALRSVTTDLPGLDVELDVVEEVLVDPDRALAVLRCVQEAMTNALRHSGARHLRVSVLSDTSGLRVEAQDDGRGVPRVVPGNGLTGMRERFAALGGAVDFVSEPGAGFRLRAQVPA